MSTDQVVGVDLAADKDETLLVRVRWPFPPEVALQVVRLREPFSRESRQFVVACSRPREPGRGEEA